MECYDVTSFVAFQDLLQIPSGTLVHLLQKVVAFAKEHVLSCWLCRQKGFICEVCNNPKVIYPFDMESTYRVSRIVWCVTELLESKFDFR